MGRNPHTGKLLALDQTLASTLPALLTLLDVPIEDARWQALDLPQRRQRTFARSPTGVSFTTGAGCSIPGSWRRSRGSTPTA
jgi:hypothetical protein